MSGSLQPQRLGPTGFSSHGISSARILEWVTISFLWACPNPGIWPMLLTLAGKFFTAEPPGNPSLEWVAISPYRGYSWLRDQISISSISCLGRWIFLPLSHLWSLLYMRLFVRYIYICIYMMLCMLSHFSSVRLCATHGQQPTRLLWLFCPQNSPGKNIGVTCHFLLPIYKILYMKFLHTIWKVKALVTQ